MKKLILAMAAVAVVASPTTSLAEWTKIGAGPSYDVAEAQCALMAMGAQTGTFAYGSTEFVAGAMIGNAIGNMIRTSIVKEKCMTINGWKNIRKAPKRAFSIVKRGKNGKKVVNSVGCTRYDVASQSHERC